MVTIRILQATTCGGQRVEANAVVDASERDAHILLSMGKAVLASNVSVAFDADDIPTDASTERAAKGTTKTKAKT